MSTSGKAPLIERKVGSGNGSGRANNEGAAAALCGTEKCSVPSALCRVYRAVLPDYYAGSAYAALPAAPSSTYSAMQRLVNLGFFWISCLITTLAIIAASNYAFFPNPQPASMQFQIRKAELSRGIEDGWMRKPTTLAEVRFDLTADFTPMFHWNAKQIYLYVVLEYSTPQNQRNEMIIWDKIIQSPAITGYGDGGRFSTRNARNKYPIADINDALNGVTGRVSVRWNIVPNVGRLAFASKGQHNQAFPVAFAKGPKQ